MNIKQFKLIRNRQKPNICYSYIWKDKDIKYTIFTMNAGKSFLASIEELRLDNRYYSIFSKTVSSLKEALNIFKQFKKGELL